MEYVPRVIRFLKRALHIERRLTVGEFHRLVQLSEDIVAYGRLASQHYVRDPAAVGRTVGVDVDDAAFRLRETTRDVAAALVLLEKKGQASRTWLDGHWILFLKPQDTCSNASEGHKNQRSA